MKRCLILWMALALLAAAWLNGCSGRPADIAPPDEPTASPSQGRVGGEETATPTVEPNCQEGTTTPTRTPLTEEETMTPKSTPSFQEGELPPGAEGVVRLALEDLARRLDVSLEEILVISVEAVEWSDTSLGCPQPGMMYAQVITPGFRVVLEAEGETYDYHADRADRVVLCQSQ